MDTCPDTKRRDGSDFFSMRRKVSLVAYFRLLRPVMKLMISVFLYWKKNIYRVMHSSLVK